MLWPRLGGFDADLALRDDRMMMQRLGQAFGEVCFENPRMARRFTATDVATEAALPAIAALLHPAPPRATT